MMQGLGGVGVFVARLLAAEKPSRIVRIIPLRRQRLEPFNKLAGMLLDHLEGILNY